MVICISGNCKPFLNAPSHLESNHAILGKLSKNFFREGFQSQLTDPLIHLGPVDRGDKLPYRQLLSVAAHAAACRLLQRTQGLAFTPQSRLELGLHLGLEIVDVGAVGRVPLGAPVRLHDVEGLDPCVQVLDDRGAVAENIVASKHCILLLQNETHVVVGVARGVYRADGGAFDAEDLPIFDRLLRLAGSVLVDVTRKLRV